MRAGFVILLSILATTCQVRETPRKVIVVHARGGSYTDVSRFLETQNPDVPAGLELSRLTPITNAVTISNIGSYETGTYPAEHGIVGHLYAKRDSVLQLVSGFNERFQVAAFWEVADDAGLQVLNIGSLTLHGQSTSHRQVDCMAQGRIERGARFIQLVPAASNTYQSLDTTDSRGFYKASDRQKLIVDNDSDPSNGFLTEIPMNQWGRVHERDAGGTAQSYAIKWLAETRDTITLYQRATFSSRGYPSDFISQVDSILGPAAGWPNIAAYTSGQLPTETLLEEIDFEMNYVMDAFQALSDLKEYELIMVDYPLIDRYGHLIYRLAQDSARYDDLLLGAYGRLFEDIKIMEEFASDNGYALIVSSGHGFSGIHSSININRLLEEKGINTSVSQADWEAVGIPGKVSSHIYMNPDLTQARKQLIVETIKSLKTSSLPTTGEFFIEEIYEFEELGKIQMDHKNAGDFFVLLTPGHVFQNELSPDGELVVPRYLWAIMGIHRSMRKLRASFMLPMLASSAASLISKGLF